jgi:hypothetical protein
VVAGAFGAWGSGDGVGAGELVGESVGAGAGAAALPGKQALPIQVGQH